ncbi:MAG: FHA domain-containing protein [Isosphaeraceae bacterium]
MKVQLIVVRGKSEGKVIPLAGPKFKIGRGETCHLRPNSEQVSREHAEFTIESSAVIVRDLGSRNGTLVNGKALTTEACKLKDRDLVQVGPLTFAVSIHDAPKAAAKPATPPTASPAASAEVAQAKAKPSPDDVPAEDIDSWLFGGNTNATVDQPTVVYGGDTLTITAIRNAQIPLPQPSEPPSVADDAEYERQTEEEELETQDDQAGDEETGDEEAEDEEAAAEQNLEEELMDPSNPFYVAKKAQKEQSKAGAAGGGPHKQEFKDSSDTANDILRKLMERRRASKS